MTTKKYRLLELTLYVDCKMRNVCICVIYIAITIFTCQYEPGYGASTGVYVSATLMLKALLHSARIDARQNEK